MKIVKRVLAVALSFVLAFAFVGCETTRQSDPAATVGTAVVYEDDVTAHVELYRIDPTTGAARDDVTWATYLQSVPIPENWLEFFKARGYTSETYTPEILREFVIRNNFAVHNLIIQKAAAAGIEVDQEAVKIQMDALATEANAAGYSLEQYVRQNHGTSVENFRLKQESGDVALALVETVITDLTQEELDEYIRENISAVAGKEISMITIAVDTANTEDAVRTKMQNAKKRLDDGTDFATVVSETVSDEELIALGGNIGWGREYALPADVSTALAALEQDQVSDIIEIRTDTAGTSSDPSDDTVSAMYIVKYTDEYILPDVSSEEDAASGDGTASDGTTADGTDEGADNTADTDASDSTSTEDSTETPIEGMEDTSGDDTTADGTEAEEETNPYADLDLSDVPQSLKDYLAKYAKANKIAEEQDAYWTSLAQSDEIIVLPMPEGLSYAVDMSLATPADDDSEDTPTTDSAEAVAAAEANGLVINDTIEGSGVQAQSGDTVMVYYTGTLSDGTVFDSNADGARGPFEVVIDQSSVIDGWHEGLKGLRVGGKRTLTIPPSLGYGATGSGGSIPPNAILTFEIELVSVNGDSTGYSGTNNVSALDSSAATTE